MGTTYRFLAAVDEASTVLDWFRALPGRAVEHRQDTGSLFYFPEFGPLNSDPKHSPLSHVFLPVSRRAVLTTVGEVHFLASPLSQFPGLDRVSRRFREWLRQFPCVFSRRSAGAGEWDYFLEGSTRNWDSDIFALPSGMAALRRGAYFIAHGDSPEVVNRVCRQLELRGVARIGPSEPDDTCGK